MIPMRLALLVSLMVVAGCTTPILKSTHSTLDTAVASTRGAYYFLPKALLHVRILKTTSPDGTSNFSMDFFDEKKTQVIERQIVPDPDHLYILDYQASASSDDTVKLTLDSNGLLTKIEVPPRTRRGRLFSSWPTSPRRERGRCGARWGRR